MFLLFFSVNNNNNTLAATAETTHQDTGVVEMCKIHSHEQCDKVEELIPNSRCDGTIDVDQ